MRRLNRPLFFFISAIAGITVAVFLMAFTLYQYANLSILVQTSPSYGVTLSQSLINSEETNYFIIIIATAPLMIISLILLIRSLNRIRREKSKRWR
jgi:glycerol-3-phosphate acyltransferase PlsY